MQTSTVLDLLGEFIAQIKGYAAKLPPVVHLAVVPTGIKPKPESVDLFEQALSRFREQSGRTPFKGLQEYVIESLEAFEAGNVLGAVQPLLAVLDHLDRMKRDKEIKVTPAEEQRLGEYRTALIKILPGSQPELEGAGRGM
ncbi:hypothetical protein FBQ96_11795 [Nitrospirales bacterium NOB]|nr:MAG: hypothetical protein UZ03_NOB001002011 [Nitrospira sp. OLB3]MBV6469973.1 hypothetical protein [Nitrospirota bacterium]MCE7964620.1 hypothetical protein [Nitrospira sp. NTP2]MCK6493811.1 hypothetical protein [Nitrospira sp.]MDL1890243.1 hypothetical protein [Nitrospirales bacterium NOB]MEB2338284.1 hypothetical protein [Nitrospirales bacterium]